LLAPGLVRQAGRLVQPLLQLGNRLTLDRLLTGPEPIKLRGRF
jgi:hypothetical protein